MSVESALAALRVEPRFMRNIARWEHLPARSARLAAIPLALDSRLAAALDSRGISALYTHQVAAVEAALAGEHVAVATPAASGKTLCYNLPVLHRLLADPRARALYLFPTKALAQDQLAELRDLTGLPNGDRETRRQGDKQGRRPSPPLPIPPSPYLPLSPFPPLNCATYDGDTPSAQRGKIRDGARIILSNPDMLHAGILPQHPRWAGFFANLAMVVIDEMHVYRGVFGSHVANVLRRLRRLCRFYGSSPQFMLASATIANPGDLAERLVEAPVAVIGPEQDGAPQGERHVIFYNPPLIDPALGLRRSNTAEAADLAAHFVAHDVQTIVFARTRLLSELALADLRLRIADCGTADANPQSATRNPQSIRGYRSGYLPEERRAIERGLREGKVHGVVATTALELGIDIGQMGAAVLAGYPGTVASTRQQMGRAGRRQGASIGLLVAGAEPLDQYIITHPGWLLGRSPEHARVNPNNEIILAGHLACAAAELPIRAGEEFAPGGNRGFSRPVVPRENPAEASSPDVPQPHSIMALLNDLTEAGQLYRSGDRYYWAGDGSPASALSLRSTGPDRVVIQTADDAGRPQVIGEVDRPSVILFLYQGAIYLHEGTTYVVERLDMDAGIAHVRPVAADFYTRPVIGEGIEVLTTVGDSGRTTADSPVSNLQPPTVNFQSAWGDVRVIRKASGYKIMRRGGNEMLGFGEIDLPEQTLETQACWLTISQDLIDTLKAAGEWLSDPNEYGPNWPAQRAAARQRDGYRCQGCGIPEAGGRQHDVHHKIPFRAFVADASLREGLPAALAWQVANRPPNLVTLCPACHRRAETAVRTRSGLGGAATLLAGVAPIFLMCDPRDLGVVTEPQDPTSGLPTITLYETAPGGVGYAEQLCAAMPDLLAAARDLAAACPCENGCPACVGPVIEHAYALDTKALALALLEKAAAGCRNSKCRLRQSEVE